MKLKQVEIYWFWNYIEPFQLDFTKFWDSKYFVLIWENWIWKSMIFELIVDSLFDYNRWWQLKNLIPTDFRIWSERSYVHVTFDHLWTEYRIEKSTHYNWSDYIEMFRIQWWKEELLTEWNREAKAFISDFVWINRNAFFNSVYAEQWDLLSFIYETPWEARKIIMNLLWLEIHNIKSKNAAWLARQFWKRVDEKDLEIEALWINSEEIKFESKEEVLKEKKKYEERKNKLLKEIDVLEKKDSKIEEIIDLIKENEDILSIWEYDFNKKLEEMWIIISELNLLIWKKKKEALKEIESCKTDKEKFSKLEEIIDSIKEEYLEEIQILKHEEIELAKKEQDLSLFWESLLSKEIKELKEENKKFWNITEWRALEQINDDIKNTNTDIQNLWLNETDEFKEVEEITWKDKLEKELATLIEKKTLVWFSESVKSIISRWNEIKFDSIEEEEYFNSLSNDKTELSNKIIEEQKRETILNSSIEQVSDSIKDINSQIEKWEILLCLFCWHEVDNHDEYKWKLKEHKVKINTWEDDIKKAEKKKEKLNDSLKSLKIDREKVKNNIKLIELKISKIDFDSAVEIEKEFNKIEKEISEKKSLIKKAEQVEINKKIIKRKHLTELLKKFEEEKTNQENFKKKKELEESIKKKEEQNSWLKEKLESDIKRIKEKDLSKKLIKLNASKDSIDMKYKEYKEMLSLLNSIKLKQTLVKSITSDLKEIWIENISIEVKSIPEIKLKKNKEKDFEIVEKDLDTVKEELDKLIVISWKFDSLEKLLRIKRRFSDEQYIYNELSETYWLIANKIFDEAIPIIETLVNKKISISSNWKYWFYIDTILDWKPVFAPKIYKISEWRELSSRSVRTLSWWEAVWIATALRDAKVFLASKRTWLTWEFNINDEIFWSQDEEHREILIESIFESNFATQVFFITHVSEVIEKVKDLWWTVLKLWFWDRKQVVMKKIESLENHWK